ncbi:MAG: glycosyltransferase [Actinomycetes bacterium]
MKVALVSGLCVEHDAISASVLHQREVLLEAGHEVMVFAMHGEVLEPPDVLLVHDPWTLHRDPYYSTCDLVVLHFGIGYPLFDVLVLDHPTAVRVVHFHNVTPPALLDGDVRLAAERGLQQVGITERADVVWSDSPHNTEVLLRHSRVPAERVRLMPLCVPPLGSPPRPAGADGPLTFLSVGRYVPAKGLDVLLEAFALVPGAADGEVRLCLVGGRAYSAPGYADALRVRADELGVGDAVELLEDLSEDDLSRAYREADVYVSASRHEGFCVPVVEALGVGCGVVVTAAGALPDTAGGFGPVVPVDDVEALAAAMVAEADRVRRGPDPARQQQVEQYVARFDRAHAVRRLVFEAERAVRKGSVPTMSGRVVDPFRYAERQARLLALLGCPTCGWSLTPVDAVWAHGSLASANLVCADHGRVGVVDSFRPGFLERDLDRHEANRDGLLVEQLDLASEVVTQGDWRTVAEGLLGEGTAGDSATFECGSGGFELVLLGSDWSGTASVEVDGGPRRRVELYRAAPEDVVVTSGPLGPGPHRVSVVCTGEQDPAGHAAQVVLRSCRRFTTPEEVRVPDLIEVNRGNPYPPRFLDLVAEQPDDALILDCGGGNRRLGDPRVFNLEYLDFELPDLYGDGLCLPFQDGSWDLIMSQAVLEHVPDPQVAVDEMVRVLRPGGLLYIEAAFMQPLHAVPSHYMNITPFGLDHLCRDLEVLDRGVFGGLAETLRWIGYLVDADEKLGADRFETVLSGLRDLDARLTPDELRQTASAVYVVARKPGAGDT